MCFFYIIAEVSEIYISEQIITHAEGKKVHICCLSWKLSYTEAHAHIILPKNACLNIIFEREVTNIFSVFLIRCPQLCGCKYTLLLTDIYKCIFPASVSLCAVSQVEKKETYMVRKVTKKNGRFGGLDYCWAN